MARRKMPRRNARGRFVKGNPTRRRHRRTTATHHRRRRRTRRNPVAAAPRRVARRRSVANPRRHRRRVRRNPIGGKFRLNRIVPDLLMPAAIGAVGAIGNDALFTYLPLPVALKTPGVARYATKGATAVLLTFVASMVVKRQTAVQMGVGALTTLTAEIARNFMAQNVPALAPAAVEGMGLYTMGYYNPALPAGGAASDMSMYTNANAPPAQMAVGEFNEGGYQY